MIRDISLYDVHAICEMLCDLREESPAYNFVDEDWDYVPNNLKNMICYPSFIGVIDDDYRGFMFGFVEQHWYSKRTDAFEQLLYVHKDHRGGMLAPRLIREFEKLAKAKGATKVYAGATTDMNDERTINMYIRMGYTPTLPAVRKEL